MKQEVTGGMMMMMGNIYDVRCPFDPIRFDSIQLLLPSQRPNYVLSVTTHLFFSFVFLGFSSYTLALEMDAGMNMPGLGMWTERWLCWADPLPPPPWP